AGFPYAGDLSHSAARKRDASGIGRKPVWSCDGRNESDHRHVNDPVVDDPSFIGQACVLEPSGSRWVVIPFRRGIVPILEVQRAEIESRPIEPERPRYVTN